MEIYNIKVGFPDCSASRWRRRSEKHFGAFPFTCLGIGNSPKMVRFKIVFFAVKKFCKYD